MYEEFGEDAAMPLACSKFEPKTPFLFNGLIHNPAQEGSAVNRGRPGSGADFIEATDELVRDEIDKGLHEVTGRPMSALLNHCKVVSVTPGVENDLREFYSTVKRRKAARRRVRVEAKKEQPQTKTEVHEESFGVVEGGQKTSEPQNGEAPKPKKKPGRPPKKKADKKEE